MRELLPHAEKVGALLKTRGETIAIAESSTGGLITAVLLAVPGASAYCLGGSVIYTRSAWKSLRDFNDELFKGFRAATEPNALIRAQIIRDRFSADWGIGETGASGPTGNRYGDAAGHTCIAVAGRVERTQTIETGRSDRVENMYAFAAAALTLMAESLLSVS